MSAPSVVTSPVVHSPTGKLGQWSLGVGAAHHGHACQLASLFSPCFPNQTTLFAFGEGRRRAVTHHPTACHLFSPWTPPLGFPPGGPWMAPRAKTSSVLQATTDTTTQATTSQATRRHRQGRLAGCLGRRARGRSVWWRLTVHMKFPSRPKQRDPPSRILFCRQSSRPKDGWVKSAPWIRKYLAWSCCSPCEPVTILCSCRSG